MTNPTDTLALDEIEARLRKSAQSASVASKFLASEKTGRNRDAGDEGATYSGLEPDQTLEWQAADALKSTASREGK
jgi:hypothetical protein